MHVIGWNAQRFLSRIVQLTFLLPFTFHFLLLYVWRRSMSEFEFFGRPDASTTCSPSLPTFFFIKYDHDERSIF